MQQALQRQSPFSKVVGNNTTKVAIGINARGDEIFRDLSNIHNVLITGTTGSGKTEFVRGLLASIIQNNDPTKARVAICDSKQIDYSDFTKAKNMLFPIVNTREKAVALITWMKHHASLQLENSDGVETYLVLDDFATFDFDSSAQNTLLELLRISRRTKSHVLLVTSTPTSKYLTAEIKALLDCRISFRCASPQMSKSVLGYTGAEKLGYPGEFMLSNHYDIIQCKAMPCPNIKSIIEASYTPVELIIQELGRFARAGFREYAQEVSKTENKNSDTIRSNTMSEGDPNREIRKLNSNEEKVEEQDIEVTIAYAYPNGETMYTFRLSNITEICWHKGGLFSSGRLEVHLNDYPTVHVSENGIERIEKGESKVAIGYSPTKKDEAKLKELAYRLAHETGQTIRYR